MCARHGDIDETAGTWIDQVSYIAQRESHDGQVADYPIPRQPLSIGTRACKSPKSIELLDHVTTGTCIAHCTSNRCSLVLMRLLCAPRGPLISVERFLEERPWNALRVAQGLYRVNQCIFPNASAQVVWQSSRHVCGQQQRVGLDIRDRSKCKFVYVTFCSISVIDVTERACSAKDLRNQCVHALLGVAREQPGVVCSAATLCFSNYGSAACVVTCIALLQLCTEDLHVSVAQEIVLYRVACDVRAECTSTQSISTQSTCQDTYRL